MKVPAFCDECWKRSKDGNQIFLVKLDEFAIRTDGVMAMMRCLGNNGHCSKTLLIKFGKDAWRELVKREGN